MSTETAEQLKHMFEPRSVAVIGASNTMGKWGYIVPANIIAGGYTGKFYPVNPKANEVFERPAFKSVKDIPDEVDLAIICIPAAAAPGALRECVEKGVKTAIVISGGFGEVDAKGAQLEEDMLDAIKGSSLRLCGPNTMGIYSGPISLHALMPPVRPIQGKIAFAAQSGNLGTQLMSLGRALGVGFSRFVCIGNETDLKAVDYVEYFADDPATDVILLYIEGLKDARRFIEVAERTSSHKPIVVLKAGKTEAGAKAAASHSAALAADQTIFQGVLKQTGMIEADTTEEMLDIAKAFAAVPLPKGKAVGVVTWGGGWGVVTADALSRYGLELVELPKETLDELAKVLPEYWSPGNPVDLVAALDMSIHFKCLEIVARCPVVDSVISLGTMGATSSFQAFALDSQVMDDVMREHIKPKVINSDFLKQLQRTDEAYRDEVFDLMQETQKPIMAVSLPTAGATSPMLARQHEVVIYPSPERGAKTLAALYEYREFLEKKVSLV